MNKTNHSVHRERNDIGESPDDIFENDSQGPIKLVRTEQKNHYGYLNLDFLNPGIYRVAKEIRESWCELRRSLVENQRFNNQDTHFSGSKDPRRL